MEMKILAQQLGISHQMANRLKKQGMDCSSLEAATAWRKSNIDPFRSKTGRIGGNTGGGKGKQGFQVNDTGAEIGVMVDQVKGVQLDLETTDADELFKNARALKEKAAALQAAAEHESYVGLLMEKKAAEKIIFERGRQFRDGLMSLSRKLAPEIAGNPDMTEVEGILNSEFRLILENFANLPPIQE